MKHNCYLVFFSFLFAACSASLPYAINYPLSNELFYSRDAEFNGKVPNGWFASPLDSLPQSYKTWLMKKDYSAAFHIEELRLDQLSTNQVQEQGMILLAKISMASHKESPVPAQIVAQPKEFTVQKEKFCGYELQSSQGAKRIVVFSRKGRFYECVIESLGLASEPQNTASLFSVQQTALASLVFR